VGWITYLGTGLYCGILRRIGFVGSEPVPEFDYIREIVLDVILRTDIAYELSLGVEVAKHAEMKFARHDEFGHTLIYPEDAEELLEYIDGLH
jgi:hypothetical protein